MEEASESAVLQGIGLLARFCALRLVRNVYIGLFSVFTLYALFTHRPIYSFYLLACCLLLPGIFSILFKKRLEKSPPAVCEAYFPVFSKKMHFTRTAHTASLATFYLVLFLLLLWRRSILRAGLPADLYTIFPFFGLMTGLFLFLAGSLFFRFYLRYRLRNGIF